jgi:hypothetical protein
MNNKRIIWLTIFLILCLVGSGVYYAISGESLPCKMTYLGKGMIERLRYTLNYRYLTSKLIQYAQQEGIDPATWDHIEVVRLEEEKGWSCLYYATSAPRKPRRIVLIRDDGTFSDRVIMVDIDR